MRRRSALRVFERAHGHIQMPFASRSRPINFAYDLRVPMALSRNTATVFIAHPKHKFVFPGFSVKHGYCGFGSSGRGTSPKPFACMARCTLFWKLASSPLIIMMILSAMMPHRASTQGRSGLAKSLST
jgi:hypothetical protein